MNKRLAAGLLLALAAGPVLRADWKAELNSRLGRNPDYRAARDFLVAEVPKLQGDDKQAAAFILQGWLDSKR